MSGTLSAGTVSIGVKSDTKGFGSSLSKSLMGEVGGIGKLIGGGIAAGIGVAIAGISAVVGVGLKEAMDAEKINAQFAAGIKSTGNAANLSVKGMDDLASSIAAYSGQSWESIGSTEKLLQTFVNIKNVGPNKIFDQATVAAADMAAKMGGDASGMAIKLGKALNDPVKGMTALGRVGVQFTQSQKDSIAAMVKHGDVAGAQGVILAELQKEFGGAAKAAGETLPGQLSRAKVAFGEMSKGVMESVLPLLTPMVQDVAAAFTNTLVPGVKAMVEAFKAGGDDVTSSGFAGIMERIGLAARHLVDFFKTTVIPGIGALVAGFKDGGDAAWSSGFPGVMERIGQVVRGIADYITKTVIPAVQNFITEFKNGSGAGGIFKAALEKVAGAIMAAVTGIVKFIGFLKDHTTTTRIAATVVGLLVVAVEAHNVALFISSGRLKEWIAQTVIVRTATATWAAIQWVLNASIWANPITWVVAGIIALIAAIVLIATRTTWFQTAWQYMTSSIATAISWLWNGVLKPVFQLWLNAWMLLVGAIINGAADAFGWIPGIGPKLKAAQTWFNSFKDGVNASLNGIPKNVPVAVNFSSNFSVIGQQVASLIGSKNKLAAMGKPGSNASGTDNWRGGPTWVNERGGEIIDLPSGSRVIPADKSAKMLGKGDTHNWYVTGPTPEALYMQFSRRTAALGAV